MAIAFNHSRATGAAKLVLLGIASHDGDGGAWPAVATLARYAGVNVRNAQKALARLVELGEIRIHQNQGGTAHTPDHTRPNLYEFTLTCSPDCDRTKRHRSRYELDPLSPATPPVARDTSPLSPATPELPKKHPSKRDSGKPTAVNARATVPEAPRYPKFTPDPPREAPRPRSAAEAAEVADLEAQSCPAATRFTHWYPGDLTECARGCGLTLTHLEPAA